MAKCLRCRAGNEWIQGRVRDEPEELLAEVKRLRASNAGLISAIKHVGKSLWGNDWKLARDERQEKQYDN